MAMQLLSLDHVNIHSDDTTRLAEWYEDVLGLARGPRPNFPFPGYWLYLGAAPIVHLVQAEGVERPEVPALEHFSLRATGLADLLASLTARGIAYRLADVPDVDTVQVNFFDCDGNHVHVDFPLSERTSAMA